MNNIELEKRLLYQFINKELLEEALRHSSFVNEQYQPDIVDNERLEFLGDAVINFVIGHTLMKEFPSLNEGELSTLRSILVKESGLAEIARNLDLGSYMKLGKGENLTNGREKSSLLADTLEAVIAAIYLDGGIDAVFDFIEKHFLKRIYKAYEESEDHDYKSRLQKIAQINYKMMPEYNVISENGPDHDRIFGVQVHVGEFIADGVGKSKKIAGQDAAENALKIIEQNSADFQINDASGIEKNQTEK